MTHASRSQLVLIAAWPHGALLEIILTGLTGSLITSLWIAITETAIRTGTFIIRLCAFTGLHRSRLY